MTTDNPEAKEIAEIIIAIETLSTPLKQKNLCVQLKDDNIMLINLPTVLAADATSLINKICKIIITINKQVLINLSECEYLASMALGAIAELTVKLKEQGKTLVIVTANHDIMRMITLLGFDTILTITETVDSGLQLFNTRQKDL